MARIRTVKPDFFLDEDLAELSMQTRLAFIGLWCLADRNGVLPDRPKWIKAQIFPYENVDPESFLNELQKKKDSGSPFIVRYSVDGKDYIHIVGFLKHQRPHHTEAESCFPLPNGEITVKPPLSDGEDSEGREGKGREGKGDTPPVADATAPAYSPKQMAEAWNGAVAHYAPTKIPKVQRMTNGREAKCRARIKGLSLTDASWKDILNAMHRNEFLSGERPTKGHEKWCADFDWVISNDTIATRILEGAYGKG